ncbi:MAG: extracellular solute-binding protein [Phycisphaerales bacterium]|nr:extracellular solute-binding protein [Phycisphaerales bacterium]
MRFSIRSVFAGLLALAAFFAKPVLADEFDLVVITPHNDAIQTEFTTAFSKHVGRPVKIRWFMKPTGQALQTLDATDKASKGGTLDIDVFFGGGVPDHDLAASRGFLERPKIPDAILSGIPREIAGVSSFHPDGLWYGSALSTFGILMNRRGLSSQNIPEPETWADLAGPKLRSWVIVADPRRSSSVRVCYELVLQSNGWEKGWPMIQSIFGNARLVADSSNAIPNEIAKGDVLAGPCIDFYGYAQVAKAGPEVLKYINAKGGSAITPDPISMLRKPPHREMAEKFIAFVLSVDGQKLWILPVGEPGGPTKFDLRRTPVRPDVCEQFAEKLVVLDPFKAAAEGAFRTMDQKLEKARTTLLAELIGAACVELLPECQSAWKALIDGGMKPAALEEWNRLPFTEAESLEIAKQLAAGDRESRKIVRKWTSEFKEKYEKVKKLAR